MQSWSLRKRLELQSPLLLPEAHPLAALAHAESTEALTVSVPHCMATFTERLVELEATRSNCPSSACTNDEVRGLGPSFL